MYIEKSHRQIGNGKKCLLATLMLSTAFTSFNVAHAQNSSETAGSLDEIIVTARKREESLQETPIAVTAVGAAQIEERNIQSVAEITNFAPNIQFDPVASESGGGASSQISIRGIGQTDWTITVEPGVGLYIDDVYVGKSVGSLMDAVDLENIQVLRGPQGTLFGKNTLGGAVVVNSKRPADENTISAEVTGGSYNRVDLKAVGNVALSDTARVRASIASQRRDGFVDRVLTGGHQGNKNSLSGRVVAEVDVTPDLLATFSADMTRIREQSPGQITVDINENAFFASLHNSIAFPNCAPPNPDRLTNPQCANSQYARTIDSLESTNTGPNRSDTDVFGASMKLDYAGEGFGVKSITAYRDVDVAVEQELTGTPTYNNDIGNFTDFQQFSQELQVSFDAAEGRLKTLVGAFFLTEDGSQEFPVLIAPVEFSAGGDIDNESYAIFGQSSFDFNDTTSLTVGARYSIDEKSYTPQQQVERIPAVYADFWEGFAIATNNGFLVQEGLDIFPRVEVSSTDKEFTPTVTLDHQFSDEVFGYASYSRGFKGGGFTQRGFPPIVPGVNTTETDPNVLIPSFEPETADVFEVGIKTNLVDNRVRFNLAGFYSDYKDIQLLANAGISAFVPTLINAGDATIWGIEAELEAVVSDRVRVNGGLGYLNSSYDTLSPAAIGAGASLNNEIPNSPEFSGNAGITVGLYESDHGTLSARGDVSYKSQQAKTIANDPILIQDGYALVNASLTYKLDDKPWAISGGVTNLTDKIYIVSGVANGGIGYAQATINRPREFYAKVKYGF